MWRRKRYWVLFFLFMVAVAWMLRGRARGPKIAANSYLLLDVGGTYTESPPQDLLGRVLHHRERTLIDLLTTIRKAQVDGRIKGVIVKLSALNVGWAKVQDIRDALLEFRKSNKPLIALLESEGTGGNKEYYLATAAERIYLPPGLTAPLSGLQAEFFFLGGVWEKLDIDMHVEKIGEYKTFGDMIENKSMTAAHRAMANSLLDSFDAQLVAGVAQGRDLEPETVRALIDRCPLQPADLETARLSNGTKFMQDLEEELGSDTPIVSMKDYAEVREESLGLGTGPKIAVVYAVGTIIPGESGSSIEGEVVGADTASEALEDAARDSDVRAIVLRVDSPGGSAFASDLLWRATQAARKKKPVIASMSDVAASGGYYIAAGANRVVAQPGTTTGSIGVLAVRPYIKGLLERLGVTTETISRGSFAELSNPTTPLTPEGRERLIAEMDYIYSLFVERVSGGRGLSRERVNELGRGRVWTGAQAKDNGLVDELGGFKAAVEAAKKAAGIAAEKEVELTFYPRAKGILERIDELLEVRVKAAVPRALQAVMRWFALPFREGALLTMMPEEVEVH